MKASHRKSDFLRGFDPFDKLKAGKLTMRRGVSGIVVVFIVAGFFVASVGFLSWKFKQGDSSASQGFFNRTSALISKTFSDMFSSGHDKLAAEIDLGKQSAIANNGEIKNPAVATNEFIDIQSSGQKKLTEKVSENENSDSPEKNPIVQSSTSGNNFSVNSPSDLELPTNNPKILELSSPVLCDFKKVQTPNHKILFSEIAWMGSTKSTNDEWIELKNNSGSDVPLAGWQILSDDENLKITFDEKNNVPASGFYLLERSDDNSVPNILADEIYSGALSNTGMRLGIFSPNCELADEIDASEGWPAGENIAKKTMERSSLDLSWHTSGVIGGTPKGENSAAFSRGQTPGGSQSGNTSVAASTGSTSQNTTTSSSAGNASSTNNSQASTLAVSSSGLVLISEVMVGTDTNSYDEFVELYNPGNQGIDLTGWSLKKRSSTGSESTLLAASHLNGITLQSHRYLLVVNASTTLAVSPDVSWPKSYTLAYTQNAVVLYDGSGAKIDEASWDDIPKNESHVRDSWSSNSFHVSATPTPQNSTSQ